MPDILKAKVFISCGQKYGSDEVTIANQIKERLSQKGFEPYVATQQQSLKGLKENIFEELSSSEYFLFIDFKREQLNSGDFRGSLFSHQELAIASFLDMPVMAFREKGVKKEDGILGFLQANCTLFTDKNTLANDIADKVDQAGWKPDWKNQLRMKIESTPFEDAKYPDNRSARFFHIKVCNLNPHKQARNCYGFLKEVQNLNTGESYRVETIELKWKGYVVPFATILPGSFRFLDAFHVYLDAPTIAHFNMYADYGRLVITLEGICDYRLTYVIVSDNFNPVISTFKLHMDNSLEKVTFLQDEQRQDQKLEMDSLKPYKLLRGASVTTNGRTSMTDVEQPPVRRYTRFPPPT